MKSDVVYPNGKSKTFLYEAFFHYSDFCCTPEQYSEEIEFSRIQEINKQINCHWFSDVDGKLVVAELNIENPFIRIQITDDGFRKIPSATRKCKVAKERRVKKSSDVNKLFTPGRAIDDPLRFVGRYAQVKKIAEADISHGRLFLISGERSTGKTSIAKLLIQLFGGNMDIADYYDLEVSRDKFDNFYTIYIDISSGINNTEELSNEILGRISPKNLTTSNISRKFSLNAAGLAKYEQTFTHDVDKKSTLQKISDMYGVLAEEGKRITLIIDEFDLFEDAEAFAKTLRYWASHGVICFVLGTGDKFNSLISGHISLARNALPIKLGPLPELEFKEIFYLASMLGESIIRFDERAIKLLYEKSGGLPYFGQLFGSIHIDIASKKYGSLEKFYEHTNDIKEHIIHKEEVVEMLSQLTSYCMQFEDEVKMLEKHIPGGGVSLMKVALGETICLSESESYNEDWMNGNILVKSLINVSQGKLFIEDPVLRQYIIISRSEWSNNNIQGIFDSVV